MPSFKLTFEAIGTKWVIAFHGTGKQEEAVNSLIQERIKEFDKIYSRFRSDSLISKISKKEGEYIFPTEDKLF